MDVRKRRKILVAAVALAALVWAYRRPPRPLLNALRRVDPTPETGARLVEHYGCRRCHRIGGHGGLTAPSLDGITRAPSDPAHVALRLWLRDPSAIKPGTAMPNFRLADTEIDAILAYLEALDRKDRRD